MKLKIVRDQKDLKGMLGGHKGVQFSQTMRLFVNAEEQELIRRYKMEDQSVGTFPSDHRDNDGKPYQKEITVGYLLKGDTLVSQNMGKLQTIENEILDACKQVKKYLELARAFGDEIVIEIE